MPSLYQEAREALGPLRPRRRLGQHFLVSGAVLARIVEIVAPRAAEPILEVGPGLGFLTRLLIEAGARVWAVEIDPWMIERLNRSPLASHPRFQLVRGDILSVDFEAFLPAEPVKVVGNLPYNISSPLLFRLFEESGRFSSFVLMLQEEVAERLASRPGNKSYGVLSVWLQLHGRIEKRLTVAPEAFYPRPKVRSSVVEIRLYDRPMVGPEERELARRVVRAAFGKRRKTLANALAELLPQQAGEAARLLERLGVEPRRRGETLAPQEFLQLARGLREALPDIRVS